MTRQKQSNNGQPQGKYDEIDVDLIIPSDFDPQVKRRAKFTPESIKEFAEGIKQDGGIINPITVRPEGDMFKLIAGERRWLATKQAGYPKIPVTIRDVSDDVAFRLQVKENLDREDLHPMDEAYTYQAIKERFKYDTIEQIAAHVGKKTDYVRGRMKLNDLDETVQKAFEKDEISLGHALEIGLYPKESHQEILGLVFTNNAVRPLKVFRQQIAERFLLQLDKAIFSKEATDLRKDGLPCVKCPKRTGAEQNLFGETVGKKDCCMDRQCFNSKIEMYIFRRREEILEADYKIDLKKKKDVQENLSKVPLISNDYYVYDRDKPKENYIGFYDHTEIKSKKSDCKYSRKGIFFNGDRRGEVITFCNSKSCEKHFSKSGSAKAELSDEEREKELLKKRARREEILDSKLEPARLEILKQAASHFDAKNSIADHPNGAEYMLDVLARLWQLQKHYSSRTARDIATILEAKILVRNFYDGFERCREEIKKLDGNKKSQLFFLLITCFKGELNDGQYADQTPIIEIAETFGINHKLIDARERSKHIAKKNQAEYKKYLDAVEAGDKKAKLPRFFAPDYIPPGLWFEKNNENSADNLELEDDDVDYEEIDENDLSETTQG